MAILRFFLLFALIYYGVRLLARWLISGAREGKRPSGMPGKKGKRITGISQTRKLRMPITRNFKGSPDGSACEKTQQETF